MADSKAKKWRKKRVREGHRNPELSRSPFALADMRTRKTTTKKELLYKHKHKNRLTDPGEKGSFLFLSIH
ncbi:hypothetical protein GCM10011391_01160 [Pullulanibacillus camelliae]|uniref:Uncharacterized protein n=1 Tax=Pullulanibacillus camelliae TaxID=1707096 RepID=A0A8J2VF58_9BACL|nr:hypothetical protein [Pullulanibacillus camelliae]GGE26624.1 hypothetical protein GCM10011391_01160 [Pullulanibacillus camelliae]